jgi:hypothetical protein
LSSRVREVIPELTSLFQTCSYSIVLKSNCACLWLELTLRLDGI